MGPCPECGADRLVPLTLHVARTRTGDLKRLEVVIMRPVAKCPWCGARIYPHRVTHRVDPSESAPKLSLADKAMSEAESRAQAKHPS